MSIRTMMNGIRKKTESASYENSKFLKPTGFIDTGCYAVNRIISGNVYNGVPEGRITTFFGESGCVPSDRHVKILVKLNDKNSKYLITRTGYSASEFNIPYAKKIEWLEHVGFSLSEISREISLSRQSLIKIKNNNIANVRHASKAKIDSFIDRNTYNCTIANLDNVIDSSLPILIKTPNMFTTCSHTIKKGIKPCKEITTKHIKTVCSNDHLIKAIDWIFAENLIIGDCISTEYGLEPILTISDIGEKECFDIEIFNDDNCYYIDDVVSHNSGKSRIVAQIIINALTKNNYDIILYFDSEGGALFDLIKNSGADLSKIEHIIIANTEEAMVKMLSAYAEIDAEIKDIDAKNEIIKEKNAKLLEKIAKATKKAKKTAIEPTTVDAVITEEAVVEEITPLLVAPKVLSILDSFGMLVSNKLLVDATQKDKMVSDMGSSARSKNNFIKAMTIPVLKTNAALIILNHIYDNPGAMYTSKVKEQPGGKGLHFASSIIVQSTKSLEKDKTEGLVEGESYFKGNMIKYFTTKNRLVKLGYEAEMFVDLNYGISKYDGLIEDAKRYGYITGPAKGRYMVPSYSDKSVTRSELLNDDKIWDSFIKEFNEKSERDMQYGSGDGQTIDIADATDSDETEEFDENDKIDVEE